MNQRAMLWMAMGFLLVTPFLFWDSGTPKYPELRQAVDVVRHITSPRELGKSSFRFSTGEKFPSDFVKWMFSAMGTAEWYIVDQPGVEFSADELKAMKKGGIPLLPQDVRVVRDKPDPQYEKQIVVKPDDARRMIIVDIYLNPNGAPLRTREWAFPSID